MTKSPNNYAVGVLAGNYREFWDWYQRNTHLRVIYCENEEKIRGLLLSRLEIVGSFWLRNDALDLYEVAQTRVRKPTTQPETQSP